MLRLPGIRSATSNRRSETELSIGKWRASVGGNPRPGNELMRMLSILSAIFDRFYLRAWCNDCAWVWAQTEENRQLDFPPRLVGLSQSNKRDSASQPR